MQTSLSAGIEVVTFATKHDEAGRYKEAIFLYNMGIDFLMKALEGKKF